MNNKIKKKANNELKNKKKKKTMIYKLGKKTNNDLQIR
jgi:hypothetical protein